MLTGLLRGQALLRYEFFDKRAKAGLDLAFADSSFALLVLELYD